jgi:hypothetical protein
VNHYLPNFHTDDPSERRLQRAVEMVPGILLWTTLIGLAVLAWFFPLAMAVFAILFGLYWFIRVAYYTSLMVVAYRRLRRETGIHWLTRVKGVSEIGVYLPKIEGRLKVLDGRLQKVYGLERKLISRQIKHLTRHRAEVQQLLARNVTVKPWDSVHHLVLIATFREDYQILEASLNAILRARYPRDKIIICLATEEREGEAGAEKARRLQEQFGKHFEAFVVTQHPDGVAGEARVKGANITYAAKQMRKWLDARGIAYEDVIISAFDADTCATPEYFACLTYHYITRPDRTQCSYQPLPMYHNNIWDAPLFSRMAATVTSYWQMVQGIRPDLLITFSSHAMSFKALVEVEYWPVDIISDDSVIFYRCYTRYDGKYQTVPLFVPVHMDANLHKNYWRTFVSLYKQMRRWAWGAENLPLIVRGFRRAKSIPLASRIRHILLLVEAHFTWSTAAIILTIHVWLPMLFAQGADTQQLWYYNLPKITNWLFRFGAVSMIVSAILGTLTLPPRPAHYPRRRWIFMVLQWLLVPCYYVVLVSLPAADAQTRMMLGKYLTFAVTEKHRAKPKNKSASAPRELATHP